MILLILHVIINIRGSHLVAMFNGVSVWWHVLGVAVIVGVLIFVPSTARELQLRLHRHRINNSGFSDAACSGGTCCRSASC